MLETKWTRSDVADRFFVSVTSIIYFKHTGTRLMDGVKRRQVHNFWT